MTLKLSGDERIHNLRNYPPETVAGLRAALACGAAAEPDPHRKSFYDVQTSTRKYYIHLVPDGSIWLLATWLARPPAPEGETALLAAACS